MSSPSPAPARSRTRRAPGAACRQAISSRSCVRVVVELARLRPLEDRRELALQLPGVEEELPVDVAARALEVGLDVARPGERRRRQVVEATRARGSPARLGEREQRLARALGVLLAQALLQLAVVARRARRGGRRRAGRRRRRRRARRRARAPSAAEYAGAIFTAVCCLRRGRAADQQRQVEAAPLHLASRR